MAGNLLRWGGIFALLFIVSTGLFFYLSSTAEKKRFIMNNFSKREKELSYSIFLSNGFFSVKSKTENKSVYGLKLSRPAVSLKYHKFLLSGIAKNGVIRKSIFKFSNFDGKVCNSYAFKAKKLKVSLKGSEIENVETEGLVIKGNNLTFFYRKRAFLNFKNFCSVLKSPVKSGKLRTLIKAQ